MSTDAVCDRCGKVLIVGQFPFCRGDGDHQIRANGVVADSIPGGFVQENFGHQPETFYSWSAMRKRADQLGLQPFVRKLEKVNEGAMIDAKTLDDKRVLLSRGSQRVERDPAALETFRGNVREIKKWSEVA